MYVYVDGDMRLCVYVCVFVDLYIGVRSMMCASISLIWVYTYIHVYIFIYIYTYMLIPH